MKTIFFALLIALSTSVFAQPNTFRGVIDSTGDNPDTSYVFDLTKLGYNAEKYQVIIDVFSPGGIPDTVYVQEKVMWAVGDTTEQDSSWVTRKVYNYYVSETPDTILIVNQLPVGVGSPMYTQALVWTPFLGAKVRLIRLGAGKNKNKLYFAIRARDWK